ncbi:unnamed protein product [Sphagnum jensenii]
MLQNTWVSSEPVDEEGQFLRFCIQNVCFCHPRCVLPTMIHADQQHQLQFSKKRCVCETNGFKLFSLLSV